MDQYNLWAITINADNQFTPNLLFKKIAKRTFYSNNNFMHKNHQNYQAE